MILINGVDIAISPSEFKVTIMDLDDADVTTRTADGTFIRGRVAVKRQIEMSFPMMPGNKMSALLRSMENQFFEVTYPDPMEDDDLTKTFYVGNRSANIPIKRGGVTWWEGFQITLTEQ